MPDALRKFFVVMSAGAVDKNEISRLDPFNVLHLFPDKFRLFDCTAGDGDADVRKDVFNKSRTIKIIRRVAHERAVFVRRADKLFCKR